MRASHARVRRYIKFSSARTYELRPQAKAPEVHNIGDSVQGDRELPIATAARTRQWQGAGTHSRYTRVESPSKMTPVDWNAMRSPSGDQLGRESGASWRVSSTAFVPSTDAT